MLTKKIRILAVCLLVATMASAVASAAPMTTNTTTMPKAFSTGAYSAVEVPEGKSPTTGLDWTGDYRPMVVQISNSAEARPHWNISEADIVYEAVYWGPAHTRYTAIYSDNHPEIVGPVRSARVYHCEIRQEWDTLFVFYGGQDSAGTSIYEFFKENGVDAKFRNDGTRSGKGFFRADDRVSPHNAAANLAEILTTAWPKNDDGSDYEPKVHPFQFSSTPSYGTDSAKEVHIPYDANEYYPHYTYNAADHVYERWYNGVEEYDGKTNKRLVASNVIVQYCDLSFHQNSRARPVIKTTGEGVMDAFINGRHVRGTWTRNTLNDRTVFADMNGEEITLLPGKTYIQMIPTSSSFFYITDEGEEMTMEFGTEVMPPMFDMNETDEGMDEMSETTAE